MITSQITNTQNGAFFTQSAHLETALPLTTRLSIDAELDMLQANKYAWASLPIADRIKILEQISHDLQRVADRWVDACIAAKKIEPYHSFAQGEEWTFVAAVFRLVRLLRQSLLDIQQAGRPRLPAPLFARPDGQVVAPVTPQVWLDRLMFPGTTAEVWLEPGLSPETVFDTQAELYRNPPASGSVGLVLGAGNVSSLIAGDVLHALFVKGQVVVLKPNPVNDYLAPIITETFQSLIRRGFLRLVVGGVDVGDYLCRHSAVDTIHLTGSDKTFDAIMFGPGAEGQQGKANRRPQLTKPFTAELGNVSPIIIVPGPWTARDVQRQALRIATWLVFNAGFNCLTPRVIIQAADWPLRHQLNQAISQALSQIKLRNAYYPGANQRHAQFVATNPSAGQFGCPAVDELPWAYITDVNPADTDNICFKREAFCGAMAETALPAQSIADFLNRAVDFANCHLWGTLTATLMVHPKSAKDRAVSAAVERAIANLRYGTVLVNQYGGYGYFLMTTPWGSFAGQDIFDVQSGIGTVNNVLMFKQPQKAVVRSPFNPRPDPVKATAAHFDSFGRKLAFLEQDPTVGRLAGLFWDIVRG